VTVSTISVVPEASASGTAPTAEPTTIASGEDSVSLTFTDIFCGAGGSSIGLTAAGFTLTLAANHWQRAIDTHAANFTDAEHLCADVNNYDMRRLPKTDVLWASPICTEASPASGSSGYRRPKGVITGQLDLLEAFGHVPRAGMQRTRATFHDVIRATEVHRYRAVVVENVPDVVDRWELFDWWVDGMRRLGYHPQFLSASSAHVAGPGNPPAPQWRDRLYIVFTATGISTPDLTLHPLAVCGHCGDDVAGVQTWARSTDRRAYKVGRYRRDPASNYGQYWYTCPNSRCGRRVEPYVLPAASAIDWDDLGQRIGDMTRPLKPNTVRRIEAGLSMFAAPATADRVDAAFYVKNFGGFADPRRLAKPVREPFGTVTTTDHHGIVVPPFTVNSNHDDIRTYPVDARPLSARTTKTGDGICIPPAALAEPFLAVLRRNATATSLHEPIATVTARGNHHALIVPYYTRGTARPAAAPLDTVSTRDRFALTTTDRPVVAVPDCRYRMVKPRESLRSQRFPDTYRVTGNKGEQTMQAGNAVSANVAQWIGQRLATVLGGSRV
jgi:DNA (cytosine-5)-methyltransferase 1